MRKIILASGSPRRRELLEQIGIPFEVMTSNADEITDAEEPEKIVKELSEMKAQAVFDECIKKGGKYLNAVVIGADTIVYHDGRVLGKPKTREEAKKMIYSLSGKEHCVYTGVTILGCGQPVSFAEKTVVFVYDMSEEEIETYVSTGEPMDKAGAYGIQGRFAAYVSSINGDYNNVVGLPVSRVYKELRKAGVL